MEAISSQVALVVDRFAIQDFKDRWAEHVYENGSTNGASNNVLMLSALDDGAGGDCFSESCDDTERTKQRKNNSLCAARRDIRGSNN